ncbi:MAG: type VI secretion system baseplate subunit TssE [Gammaproteobacteria bacterium]|nr:type VI secretion system baseplate subunit TssE [Gammaproteobacteria bacterium]
MTDDKALRLSIIDRLLDDEPGVSTEPPPVAAQTYRDFHIAIRRDLEALLNTRRRIANFPNGLPELESSLVNYGIPDFTGTNMSAADSRLKFVRTIEGVIRRYEPRFKSVRVTLLDNAEPLDRTLRFRIDAVVYAEPAPEKLVFDSALEPVTGTVEVRDSSDD